MATVPNVGMFWNVSGDTGRRSHIIRVETHTHTRFKRTNVEYRSGVGLCSAPPQLTDSEHLVIYYQVLDPTSATTLIFQVELGSLTAQGCKDLGV